MLEVVEAQTRNRLASWIFGAILKDTNAFISSVKEFSYGGAMFLLVGVNNSSNQGMVCLFDVSLSRVSKAIEIPHQVQYA